MLIAIVLTAAAGLTMLAGIFWTLHRAGRLEGSTAGSGTAAKAGREPRRRWSAAGEAEFYVPDWIAAMRSGRWDGPTLPLLVTFVAMMVLLYGILAIILIASCCEDPQWVAIGVCVAIGLYVAVMTGRMLVLSNREASAKLRQRAAGRLPGSALDLKARPPEDESG